MPCTSLRNGFHAASRAGEFAAAEPTPATLLGREPTPLATVLRDLLSSG